MNRKEIAAAQKLELEQMAEREIVETRREGRAARERIDAAAGAIAGQLGIEAPKSVVAESLLPAEQAAKSFAPQTPDGATEPAETKEAAAAEPKHTPRESPDFADIAANIAGDDWKDL
jgi:hypothetical protein